MVFRGVLRGRDVSVNPSLKIPSKQRSGLNDIGYESFEWRGWREPNVIARSHCHVRFGRGFVGVGLVIIRGVVRRWPVLVLVLVVY